jgi:hypothetical protein
MLLILFFAIPVLLSVLVPRQWVGALVATLAAVWVILFIDLGRVHAGPADMFGMALVVLLTMLVLGIVGLRYVFAWRTRPADLPGLSQRWARAYVVGLFALVCAVLLTALVVQLFNGWFQSAWLTHLAVAVTAIAWWVLSLIVWRGASMQAAGSLHLAQVVRWVGAVAMVLALAWSMQSVQRVVQVAQASAGGQAYCLLSATEQGLQPVTGLLDLSGFAMQAGRGAMRHAQMATGSVQSPQWRYWSYREAAFESDFMGGVLTCEPQTDYAAKLAWFAADDTLRASVHGRDTAFWLAGGHWEIPYGYLGRGSAYPDRVHFYAHGNDFAPPQAPLARSGPQTWSQIAAHVDVTMCAPEKIHDWYQPGNTFNQVRTLSTAYGLDKQEVVSTANQVPRIQYVEKDAHGGPVTWLACDGPDANCTHAFVRDGMRVKFMHRFTELPQWRQLQDALWQRIQSFAVTWPETAVRNCTPEPR